MYLLLCQHNKRALQHDGETRTPVKIDGADLKEREQKTDGFNVHNNGGGRRIKDWKCCVRQRILVRKNSNMHIFFIPNNDDLKSSQQITCFLFHFYFNNWKQKNYKMISDRSTAPLISSVVGGLSQNRNNTGMTIFFSFHLLLIIIYLKSS